MYHSLHNDSRRQFLYKCRTVTIMSIPLSDFIWYFELKVRFTDRVEKKFDSLSTSLFVHENRPVNKPDI